MERSLSKMSFSSSKQPSKKIGGSRNEIPAEADIPTVSGFMNAGEKPSTCVFCDGKHSSLECGKSTSMALETKNELIKKKGHCFCCLRPGHSMKKCKSFKFIKCQKCSRHHHIIMCPDMHGKSTEKTKEEPSSDLSATNSDKLSMSNNIQRKEVLMETLTTVLRGKNGLQRKTRTMYDRGNQGSYIKIEVAEELGLEVIGYETVRHQTFPANMSGPVKHPLYKVEVSAINGRTIFEFVLSGLENITKTVHGTQKGKWVDYCTENGIQLTDVDPITNDIELMIGVDVAPRLYTGKKIDLECGPTATETRLGWILSGKILVSAKPNKNNMMCLISMHMLDDVVKNMWELEAIGITDPVETIQRAELEKSAMDHFRKTVCKLEDGRYEVSLPWLEGRQKLPNNFMQASFLLKKATTTLKKDGSLAAYDDILRQWEADGIIEEVPVNELNQPAHYFSHRGVYKENSTTPLRPVFNASLQSKYGPSLNSVVEKGPNLLELIPTCLTRFRTGKVGVIADIKKAFLQISVSKDDRDSMRFLWWKSLECEKEKIYRHKRVVFGISCSPFLLGATLKHHLEQVEDHKETAALLMQSMYVDNLVTSVSSPKAAQILQKESQSILAPAHFDLRGWEFGPSVEDKQVSVLGMIWNTKRDVLKFDLEKVMKKLEEPCTKRALLSITNMIFDPLGFVCPFTLKPKLLLKKACEEKVGWDEDLPQSIAKEFAKWKTEILCLEDIEIKRMMAFETDKSTWSLHVFTDSSSAAYASCVFLRSGKQEVATQLIQACSRVSPKKTATIPRLELLGCYIGSILTDKVKKSFMMPDIQVTYWTDSSSALAWIRNPGAWAIFVANRVKRIRELTSPDQWKHVPGEYNPADLPSRGCSSLTLVQEEWWEGPSWLRLSEEKWPKSKVMINEEEVQKERIKTVISCMNLSHESILDNLLNYSDYNKKLRVLAFIMRYMKNLRLQRGNKNRLRKEISELTAEEVDEAEKVIFRHVQSQAFDGVEDARLRKFRPFVDENGLIRMKSRLLLGDDCDDFKYPIILPGKKEFVKRLIWREHVTTSHAGCGILMATLRDRLWILNCRRTIGNVLLSCLKCRRLSAKKCEVQEAPLPKNRIKNAAIFEIIGVDLAGSLFLRGGKKVWICLYTCSVYRAVHLEIVESLSTVDFLSSFRRFVARRGRPSIVYSDNGKNFVGAHNLFNSLDWKLVDRYASVSKIQRIFNPPAAPWWGGFWERCIGMMKQLLRRVLGNKVVTYVELETVLTEVEAAINSRPLGYVSENPTDLRPLTPSMFLMEVGSNVLPEVDAIDSTALDKQLKRCQHVRECLKTRFRREYLGQLVHHGKMKGSLPLKPNALVLIEMPDRKRLDWPLGVVLEVFPGKDDCVRQAIVRTKDGEFLRPVQRLYPLETLPGECVMPEQEAEVNTSPEFYEEENEATLPLEKVTVDDEGSPDPVVVTRFGRIVKKPSRLNFKRK